MTVTKILIIDDENMFREDLAKLLNRKGFDCLTAQTADEGLQKAQDFLPDIVLSDIEMPGKNGVDSVKDILLLHPDCSVIMMTAFGSMDTAIEAFRQGAVDYILKPIVLDELEKKLVRIRENKRLIKELQFLRKEIDKSVGSHRIIGKSKGIQDVFSLVKQVSPTKSNVLITGESGTGKELVAREIHNRSKVSNNPFVPLNCSAFSEHLLESELFGYKKGAFTGAVKDKDGFFEVAGNGTIFLDEISEIPISMQGKLLRVIEEKKYFPVGGTKEISLNARIITATNKNLKDLITKNIFREDLFYRIAVFEINLPPLRDRRSDIPLIVEEFLSAMRLEMNHNISGLTSEAIQSLMNYRWPGNVRELRNVIERAMILCNNHTISIENFPAEIAGIQIKKSGNNDLNEALRSFERSHILQVLSECDWSKEATASRLNIHPSTLYRKLIDLEINSE